MSNVRKTTTLPAMKSGINLKGPKAWTPVYANESKMDLPIGWQCPCGGGVQTENGRRSCLKCGRIARDTAPNGKLDGYQSMDTGRELKRWRKFGKQERC
jgi:hypothetical protein